MSRSPSTYRSGGQTAPTIGGYDVSVPHAGYYRFRMTSGGFPVGIRIWFGAPHDPVTGEEMDRSWRWQATANNAPIDLDRAWPACGREPIDQAEHDHLCAVAAWAKDNAPSSPQANPTRKVNRLTAPLLL